jgi:hypothetical protein
MEPSPRHLEAELLNTLLWLVEVVVDTLMVRAVAAVVLRQELAMLLLKMLQ